MEKFVEFSGNLRPGRASHRGMDCVTPSLSREVLDEDLQIVRVTLATLSPEICRFSKESADAVRVAVEKIDEARAAFALPAGARRPTRPRRVEPEYEAVGGRA